MMKMIKVFLSIVLIILGVLLYMNQAPSSAAVTNGQLAPEFTLPDANGTAHSLSDYKNKTVVLEWLNHGCPFVKKHYNSGNMQQLQKTYTSQGIVWLSIVSSAPGKQGHCLPEEAQELTRTKEANPTAVLLDPEGTVGRLYGAQTTPHMFVINPEGILVYQGAIDSVASTNPADITNANNYVSLALNEMIAGQAVSVPQTKSYGCSVKY